MTDKITGLERTVLEEAMKYYMNGYRLSRGPLKDACQLLSKVRDANEAAPGEAEAWHAWNKHTLWDTVSPTTKRDFRAALRVAIRADREARNG